jgi:hypothetical protein
MSNKQNEEELIYMNIVWIKSKSVRYRQLIDAEPEKIYEQIRQEFGSFPKSVDEFLKIEKEIGYFCAMYSNFAIFSRNNRNNKIKIFNNNLKYDEKETIKQTILTDILLYAKLGYQKADILYDLY